MRKLLCVVALAVAVMVWVAVPAHAGGYGNPCDGYFKSVINSCHEVGHPTKKDKAEVGVGLDIPLYKTEKLIVDQESKFDLNAGDFGEFKKSNFATYTVFKPQLEEGILQTAFAKIKSLLNSGE